MAAGVSAVANRLPVPGHRRPGGPGSGLPHAAAHVSDSSGAPVSSCSMFTGQASVRLEVKLFYKRICAHCQHHEWSVGK